MEHDRQLLKDLGLGLCDSIKIGLYGGHMEGSQTGSRERHRLIDSGLLVHSWFIDGLVLAFTVVYHPVISAYTKLVPNLPIEYPVSLQWCASVTLT